jgi:hypothetical protein
MEVEEEFVLPDAPNAKRVPEHRLMLAILTDAVDCYMKHMFAIDPVGRDVFASAAEWIFSADHSWAYSMESICDSLGIEADYIRRGCAERRARYTTTKPPTWRDVRHDGRGGRYAKGNT